jgi:aryl-alcohol dehydrogenase-like predicted oxidoreductase
LDLGGALAPDVLARLLADEAVAGPADEAPRTKPRSVRAIRGLVDEPWLVAVSAPLSLCERAALPLAGGRLAVLARRPLAGGALAGTLGPGVKLARTDDRNAPDARLEAFAVAAARLALLVKQVPPAATSCERARAELDRGMPTRPEWLEAATVAELALRFVIDRGAFAMPRLHRAARVAEAMAAVVAAPLSAELHSRLDSLEF